MSRIGRNPITIPSGVAITIDEPNHVVHVKGPKGELEQSYSRLLTISNEEGKVEVSRPNNLREARSQHGLTRTLIHNMIVGVTEGHSKTLEVIGVGYRVQADGKGLILNMGYSHPVKVVAIDGINFEVIADERSRQQSIKISGISKALVGQIAADVRKVRKPEPYKGKGIRYRGEVIRIKAGKRAAAKK